MALLYDTYLLVNPFLGIFLEMSKEKIDFFVELVYLNFISDKSDVHFQDVILLNVF